MATSANNVTLKEEQFVIEKLGRRLPVFAVGPDSTEALPGLILVHEIFGVNEHIKDVARRFASQGLRVFAPDLFAPAAGFPSDPEKRNDLSTMREVWSSIEDSQLITDMGAVFDKAYSYSGVVPQQIGALGYCMGGAIAFMFAGSEPRLAWIVDYYGRIRYDALSKTKPKHPIEFTHSLKCPFLGLFAGKDELITKEHRQELSRVMESCGKTFTVKVYEQADHAFFNDQRPNFNQEAAANAWQLTLDFITQQSKGS